MSQYNKCLQITFIIFQLAFIAFGCVLIGVGAWVGYKVDPTDYQAVLTQTEFKAAPYVIVASGCVVVVIAALGMFGACCGALCNKILLGTYIIVTVVILGLQLAGGIAGFVFRNQVASIIENRISNITTTYNATSTAPDAKAIVLAWNLIQQKFQCCGINGSGDWKTTNSTPNSCCKSCSSASYSLSSASACTTPSGCNSTSDIYTTGCQSALISFFTKYLIIVAAIAIAFIISEIVVVLMAFCLLCCSKSEEK